MDHPQNIDQTPISHLFELPNIHQNMCKSVEEMIRSRTMQLIAIQTLRKINPQKASLYKKMLERNLSIDEALSLIKIIGRFLRDDSTVLYQFPSNEENIVDF